MPKVFPVNCYLIREDDGLTLIDAALPASANAILRVAHEEGMEISRILLTHGHTDHIGALDRLRQLIPEASVMISERDARLLAGDRRLQPGEAQSPIRGGVKRCRTQPTGFLTQGMRIGSLEVVFSPGHTPGHVAFFDVRDGTLIAGDALQTHAGVAVSGMVRPLFPFPAMATWNKHEALRSAIDLRKLHPAALAVGHGKLLVDPGAMMDRAIAEAQRKLEGAR